MKTPKAPLDVVARQLHAARATPLAPGFVRETYRLPRSDARSTARDWFKRFPKAAYWTQVESWRVLDDDTIEFTMRRLPTAD